MWRRYGDDLYASLVLAVFTFEALVIGVLTWGFAVRAGRALGGGNLTAILVTSVAVTALSLVTIGSYVIAYHVISARRERGRRGRLEDWTARWVAVLFENRTPPSAPLPPEGVEALLDLREHLLGTEGERVEALVRRYRIGQGMLERTDARKRSRRGLGRLVPSLRQRRLSARLEALEALAKARLAVSVEPLLQLLHDPEPAVRLMAIRSLARSLARLRPGRNRDRAARRFADGVLTTDLPPGAVEEALLLLEGAAPRVLTILLAAARPEPKGQVARKAHALLERRPEKDQTEFVARAIDAVGRQKLIELAEDVAAHVAHPEPEVRAAALRALGRIGILPPDAEPAVAAALRDGVEFVRIQAARTSMLLPEEAAQPELWMLLGDDSWWVRRAAAHALMGLGSEGPRLLERAGRSHPDRYGRHMAVQVLLDAGRLDAEGARLLREAV